MTRRHAMAFIKELRHSLGSKKEAGFGRVHMFAMFVLKTPELRNAYLVPYSIH